MGVVAGWVGVDTLDDKIENKLWKALLARADRMPEQAG